MFRNFQAILIFSFNLFIVTLSSPSSNGINSPPIILGSDPCTYGPSYWCHNIKQASNCNQTRHCINNVWGNQREEQPQDNGTMCTVCKDMVKLSYVFYENQTKEQLESVMNISCKLHPDETVANDCLELTTKYQPELLKLSQSSLSPQLICTISGLCQYSRIDPIPEKIKPQDNPLNLTSKSSEKNATPSNLAKNNPRLIEWNNDEMEVKACASCGAHSISSCAEVCTQLGYRCSLCKPCSCGCSNKSNTTCSRSQQIFNTN